MSNENKAREIHIQLPKDILQTLLRDKQTSVPFQTDELGFPLRIIIHGVANPPKKSRFGSSKRRREPGDEDEGR